MSDTTMKEYGWIATAASLASLGGLVRKVEIGKPVVVKEVVRAMLVGSIVGLTFALWTFPVTVRMPEYRYPWLGLCILAGFGGEQVFTFALALLTAWAKKRFAVRTGNTPVEKIED